MVVPVIDLVRFQFGDKLTVQHFERDGVEFAEFADAQDTNQACQAVVFIASVVADYHLRWIQGIAVDFFLQFQNRIHMDICQISQLSVNASKKVYTQTIDAIVQKRETLFVMDGGFWKIQDIGSV